MKGNEYGMNLQEALGVLRETLRDWYHGMVGLAVLNLVWVVMSLTVVLLPPATAGAFAVTNSIAHGTGQQWDTFWTNARRYVWVSLRWALLNVVVIAALAANLMFYGSAANALGVVVQFVLATGGVLWFAAQFYFWPFMIEQEQKSVRVALKNALFLTLAEPFYTAVMLGTTALAAALSVVTVLPLAMFVLSFVALLANRAVIERLTAYGKLQRPVSTVPNGDDLL